MSARPIIDGNPGCLSWIEEQTSAASTRRTRRTYA